MSKKVDINQFTCSCGKLSGVNFEEFKHHLFSEHKEKADKIKGKRQMISHIDFKETFSSTYEWTLETGLKFTQFVELSRAKDDMMRFED